MTLLRIHALTAIFVHNHKNLRAAWRQYGHTGLVGTFHCEAPLTEAQLRRLPKELQERLTIG